MYEDDDLWPFKCPACEFAKKIGWLKTQTSVKCPGVTDPGPVPCPITIQVRPEEFFLALTKARSGNVEVKVPRLAACSTDLNLAHHADSGSDLRIGRARKRRGHDD